MRSLSTSLSAPALRRVAPDTAAKDNVAEAQKLLRALLGALRGEASTTLQISPDFKVQLFTVQGHLDASLSINEFRIASVEAKQSFPDFAFRGDALSALQGPESEDGEGMDAQLMWRGTHSGVPYSPSLGLGRGLPPVHSSGQRWLIRDSVARVRMDKGVVTSLDVVGAGPMEWHAAALK